MKVFSIWVGRAIPVKYLIQMNTVWTRLLKTNPFYEFIIYTDNVKRMYQSIYSCSNEICTIKNYAKIRSISSLVDLFDANVSTVLQGLKSNGELYLSKFNNIGMESNGIQFDHMDNFILRPHSLSWALLYTCYVRRLLWNNAVFAARGTLNLRLLALAKHGGLYLDWDVMTIEHLVQHGLLTASRISKEIQKKLTNVQQQLHIKQHHPKEQMQVLIKFVKTINTAQYKGLQIPSIPFYQDTETILQTIRNTIQVVHQYRLDLLSQHLHRLSSIDIEVDSDVEHQDTVTNTTNGLFAISSGIFIHNAVSKFSQNILFAHGQEAQQILLTSFLEALHKNMCLSMLQPGSYWIHKANTHNEILPFAICPGADETETITIQTQLHRIQLPFDVFFTREKYPYLISKMGTEGGKYEITYRTGRPLHPLGQVATRGSWNFLLHSLTQFQISSLVERSKFSVVFDGVHLFPESSVIDEKTNGRPQDHLTHWTKVRLSKDCHIHEI